MKGVLLFFLEGVKFSLPWTYPFTSMMSAYTEADAGMKLVLLKCKIDASDFCEQEWMDWWRMQVSILLPLTC